VKLIQSIATREMGAKWQETDRENLIEKSTQFYLVDWFPSASSCVWYKFDIVATNMH